jgi:hypothetical protein
MVKAPPRWLPAVSGIAKRPGGGKLPRPPAPTRAQTEKSFCFFFQKEVFLFFVPF